MSTLKTLLADKARAGVFQVGPGTQSLEAAAKEVGLAVWRVDIGHVHDKKGFTALVAKAMNFPEWFGGNWDAFEDCLTDLSWSEAPCFAAPREETAYGYVGILGYRDCSTHGVVWHEASRSLPIPSPSSLPVRQGI